MSNRKKIVIIILSVILLLLLMLGATVALQVRSYLSMVQYDASNFAVTVENLGGGCAN